MPDFLTSNQSWLISLPFDQQSIEKGISQHTYLPLEADFRPPETLRPLRGQPVAVLV